MVLLYNKIPFRKKRRGLNCSKYSARSATCVCLEDSKVLQPGCRLTAESKSREQLGKGT